MGDDIKFLLGFLAVFGIMAYMGWSSRKGAPAPPAPGVIQTSQSIAQPHTAPMVPATPGTPPATSNQTEEARKREELKKAEEAIAKAEEERRKAEEAARFSPLRNQLTISGVSRGSGDGAADREYLSIRATSGNTGPVLITGLMLRSAVTGLSATIPKAWTLPFPGAGGDGDAVWLRPGSVVFVVSGKSPSGFSFQANRCTGYLSRRVTFTPSLPIECPSPLREPLPPPPNHLSDACLDYLATIPSCTVPGAIPENLRNDGSCQVHVLNKINYNTCVALHKDEPGFYRSDWRLFLNRTTPIWKDRREIIELLDQNGKLISSYSY